MHIRRFHACTYLLLPVSMTRCLTLAFSFWFWKWNSDKLKSKWETSVQVCSAWMRVCVCVCILCTLFVRVNAKRLFVEVHFSTLIRCCQSTVIAFRFNRLCLPVVRDGFGSIWRQNSLDGIKWKRRRRRRRKSKKKTQIERNRLLHWKP